MVGGNIFNLNEKLKEDIVNFFQAYKAKTVYRETGVFMIFEPYLETEVYWDLTSFKGLRGDILEEFTDMILDAQEEVIKLGGQMTDPVFEKHPNNMLLVWGTFDTKKPI